MTARYSQACSPSSLSTQLLPEGLATAPHTFPASASLCFLITASSASLPLPQDGLWSWAPTESPTDHSKARWLRWCLNQTPCLRSWLSELPDDKGAEPCSSPPAHALRIPPYRIQEVTEDSRRKNGESWISPTYDEDARTRHTPKLEGSQNQL